MTRTLLFRIGAFALAFAPAVRAQTYHWSAFAGLPPQFGAADGIGRAARFDAPFGVVGASSGNLYIADTGNYAIRRISPAGAVITYAGALGQPGAADGPRTSARFGTVTGITLAGSSLYVSDRGNHAIRRIDTATGIVTTFAGRLGSSGSGDGIAGNARFNQPMAIVNDAAGNLYVADRGNHTIRKITPQGEVTTLAGLAGVSGTADGSSSTARFNSPSGLGLGADGTLYVSDTGNHTIRKITPAGEVSTWVGAAGIPGSTNGTGSAARFAFPYGLLVYSGGTVLVCDSSNDCIRLISAAGVVGVHTGRLNVPGSRDGARADARFFSPTSLAFTSDGVVVVDALNHSIRKITGAAFDVSTFAGPGGNFGREDGIGPTARFNYPSGIAVHESGDVYLADTRGNTIRRISPNGEVVRVAGAAAGGDAYVDGAADAQSLNYPHGLAVARDRTVYFCEQQRHTIRVLHPDGSVSTLAGTEGSPGSADGAGAAARFNFPSAIALDREGNLYIADTSNHVIRRIAAGSNIVTTFAGAPGLPGSIDGTTARFASPRGVAVDRDGNVIVADTTNHTIRKISPAGVVSTLAGRPLSSGSTDGVGSAARFFAPSGVAIGPDGDIYIADTSNQTIRKIAGETVSTIGGRTGVASFADGIGSTARFSGPNSVAVDASGNVFVSQSGNNLVAKGVSVSSPAIAAQPRSLAITAGSNATLAVSAIGGALSYQWRFNGVPISGATAPTYTITDATAALAGAYSVTVINPLGNLTSEAAVVTIVSASNVGRIINLSILTSLPAAGDEFTMGFVVGGGGTRGTKPLVIRAAGPSLGALGVSDTLDDPKLELFFGDASTGGNDNWGGGAVLAEAMRSVGAFPYAIATSRDAAINAEFQSGNNSVKVAAAGSGTGTVIAEIYDASASTAFTAETPRLVNVSVLKHLGSGLTAGFALGGTSAKTILIRAIGPTLSAAPFGVDGAVADPQLALFAGSNQIDGNDNWGGATALSSAFTQVGAFALPGGSRDAALVATLQPGNYTVQVSGVGASTGVALIEIYEVP